MGLHLKSRWKCWENTCIILVHFLFRLEDSEPIYEDIDELGLLLEVVCTDGEAGADKLAAQPLCNAISKVGGWCPAALLPSWVLVPVKCFRLYICQATHLGHCLGYLLSSNSIW